MYRYLSLSAVVLNLLLGIYVLSKGPRLLLNRLLFLVLMAIVAWSTGEFLMRSAASVEEARRSAGIAAVGWCLIGGLFLLFVLCLTEHDQVLGKPWLYFAIFAPGAALLFLVWTTDLVFRAFTPSYWGYSETGGLLRLPSHLYVVSLFVTGIYLLFVYQRRAPSKWKRVNARFVLAASVIPVVTGVATDIVIPLAGARVPELGMLACAAIAPIISYAVVNHGLLTTVTMSLGTAMIDRIREAVLIVDADGVIEMTNRAAQELSGRRESELLGMPAGDLLPGAGDHVLTQSGVERFRTREEGLVPVYVSAEPVRKRSGVFVGSVLLLYDLREPARLIKARRDKRLADAAAEAERELAAALRRSGEELRSNSSFMESVIDNIGEPVFIVDRDHRYVFANQALCGLMGLSRQVILGMRDSDLMSPATGDKVRDTYRAVLETGGTVVHDFEGKVDHTGATRDLRATYTPLFDDSGEITNIVGTVTEITEQNRLDRARLDFVRIAANELRAPLSSLQHGFDALVLETKGALNREQRRSLEVLSLSIERLRLLAANLLDLASMEAGTVALERSSTDLVRLLAEADGFFSPACRRKGLYLRVKSERGMRMASADAGRISQVLNNLIGNSLKFTESGGITISATDPGGDFLRIRVTDTGTGVNAGMRDKIFESFVSASERRANGSGLGLPIARAIIEAHGGTIRLESSSGPGSTFCFTVPVARPGERSRAAVPRETAGA